MSYKIVQTIERGKKELTIVPRAWEKNGILYWPKSKADKLVNDANSVPADNWFRISCKLKRNYLANLQIAEEELSRMLEEDDTEHEELDIPPSVSLPRKRPRVLLPKRAIDLNEIAESCVNDVNNEKMTPSASNADTAPIIILQNETIPHIEVIQPQAQLEERAVQFDIAATLTEITDNQKKMMNQMARFETMFDEAMAKFNATPKPCACSERPKIDSALVTALNIQKLEDLDVLEEKLKNTDIFQEYVNKMSFICGKNGKQKGIDVSYMLVDQFFERKFLLLCSWAGGARNNKQKIPFKFYKNTIRLFFEIVHLADSDFTLSDCETFFKNIIRNAVKRNESSNTRASKSKKRPRNLSYKKDNQGAIKQHSEEGTPIENNEEVDVILVSQEKENIPVDFEFDENSV